MSCHDFGKYMKGSFAKTDNSRNQVFSLCIPINLKKKIYLQERNKLIIILLPKT